MICHVFLPWLVLFLTSFALSAPFSQRAHPRHGHVNMEYWLLRNEGRSLVEEVIVRPCMALNRILLSNHFYL